MVTKAGKATKRDLAPFSMERRPLVKGPVPRIIAFYALPPSLPRLSPSLLVVLVGVFLSPSLSPRACDFITASAAAIANVIATIERASVAECDIRRGQDGLDDGKEIGPKVGRGDLLSRSRYNVFPKGAHGTRSLRR